VPGDARTSSRLRLSPEFYQVRTLKNTTTNTTGHAALSIVAGWTAPLKTGISARNRWKVAAADTLTRERVADARIGVFDDIRARIREDER
jgi:hypothetical protein